MKDIGPQPTSFDLEAATIANTNYRTVAWSGEYLQLTLMSIPVGDSIGLEKHGGTDQFLRIDQGTGRVTMGPTQDDLNYQEDVSDGSCILVPAGTWHDVLNTGDEPLRLYVIYAPVHHAAGNVHITKADSEADEESGGDEPPEWAFELENTPPDEHAD
ncbi:MAG: cupin [Naasia sp.]|nr:cupin [Naasia sp.]